MAPSLEAGVATATVPQPTKTMPPQSNGVANGAHSASRVAPLDPSKLTTIYTSDPRPVPAPNSPEVFSQRLCTDHMITCAWNHVSGWSAPELKPYGPLSLMPTANCLHYATQCFEGMKLYRSGADGRLRLFRPARNAARMRMSCSRIALPDFEPDALEALIKKLCAVDGGRWLPKERGDGFLYIRPAMIGSDPALGVNKPKEALLYVILCVFPALDVPGVLATGAPQAAAPPPSQQANGEGNASLTANGVALPMRPRGRGMRLLASPESEIRAWPGGFGFAKLGANYGPTLEATGAARVSGYDQVLWLFGDAAEVTEAGAANFFVVWRGKESGRLELVTAPLDSRIILEGVTRASVLDLARERLTVKENVAGLEPVDVVERTLTIHEILDAYTEGRLIEAFAAGTAFFIAPVGEIHFRGTDIEVPLAEGNSGSYAKNIKDWLKDIMWGRVEHEWGVVVPDEGVPGVV